MGAPTRAAQTTTDLAPPEGCWVVVDGRSVEVDRRLIIGRARDSDIRLRGRGVAPHHLVVAPRPDGVLVEDLSRGATQLGGRPFRAGRLGPGAVLRLGARRLLLASGCLGARDAVRWHGMIGRAPATLRLFGRLAIAAGSDAPVWLSGASGTGKELAARALHDASARRVGPWVALNCAALPESLAEAELFGVERGAYTGAQRSRPGVFARADGGTLLLDEVGELPPAIQAKLLRVIETGEVLAVGGDRPRRVDVRIVVATWRDLEADAANGAFRFDLLQRLWVLRVDVPTLEARQADIAPLVSAWLAEAGASFRASQSALRALTMASWPGNIRQLHNLVRRALVEDDPAALTRDLPGARLPRRDAGQDDAAHKRISEILAACENNRAACARALGISRSTLYRWLREDARTGLAAG